MNKENTSGQSGDLFSHLLGGIEKLAKLAEDLQKNSENISKEGEVDLSSIKDGLKANYSFTVKTAAGSASSNAASARPKTRPANKSTAKSDIVVPREIELDIDVFEEADAIKIFAQFSGVADQDIAVALNGDILEIDANSAQQHFRKEILLSKKVTGKIDRAFKNGVLELTLPLAAAS